MESSLVGTELPMHLEILFLADFYRPGLPHNLQCATMKSNTLRLPNNATKMINLKARLSPLFSTQRLFFNRRDTHLLIWLTEFISFFISLSHSLYSHTWHLLSNYSDYIEISIVLSALHTLSLQNPQYIIISILQMREWGSECLRDSQRLAPSNIKAKIQNQSVCL